MKITHIAHLSDLHIGSKSDRYIEYNNVFDTFVESIKKASYKDTLLIVITGDIFHWKSRLAPEDITCFNRFMRNINPIPVLIILGNHDTVLNNKNREDLISPLVSQHPNVTYSKNTEVINIHGLKFFHISVFDDRSENELYQAMLNASTNKYHPDENGVSGLAISSETKSTNELLEDKIKRPDPVILLYHGSVDGAKMQSHTVSGCTISRRIMDLAKMCLLGDIHESQFITPSCAYAGSMIQQNVGEDTEKGFIMWSAEKCRGRFIKVPNQCMMVRVDYRSGQEGIRIYNRMTEGLNEEQKQTLLKNITRVTIITEAYGAILKQQVDEVRTAFGRMDNISTVDRGVGSKPDSIDTAPMLNAQSSDSFIADDGMRSIQTNITGENTITNKQNVINAVMAASAQLSPLETQVATIKQLIKDKADKLIPNLVQPTTVDLAKERESKINKITNGIVSLHRGYVADMPVRKWTIRSMKWDNVLIYGQGNFIDFEAISNTNAKGGHSANKEGVITGCIAPNRSGKSSIFDILVYTLFGEHLRGDKKSIFHRGTTTMAVRVDFEVNGVYYYIERVDRSSGKNSIIRLCKINQSTDNAAGNETILTGESIPDTYAKMRQLIGTLDEFLATGLFYDNENDIVRLGRTARRETLARLFGLVDNDRIIKEEKRKLKELNASLSDIENRLKNKLIAKSSTTEESFSDTLENIENKLRGHNSQLNVAINRQNELKAESNIVDADWHAVAAEIKDIKESVESIRELNMIIKMQTEVIEKKESRLKVIKSQISGAQSPQSSQTTIPFAKMMPLSESAKKSAIISLANATTINVATFGTNDILKLPEYLTGWRSQLADIESEITNTISRIKEVFGESYSQMISGVIVDSRIDIEEQSKLLESAKTLFDGNIARYNSAKTIANNTVNDVFAANSATNAVHFDNLTTQEVMSWNNELMGSILATERGIRAINIDLKKSALNDAERRRADAENKTHYKFNANCTDCNTNMKFLNAGYSSANDEYARAKAAYDAAVITNTAEEEKLAKLESKKKNMDKIIVVLKEVDAAKSKVIASEKEINSITAKLEKYKKCSEDINNKTLLTKHAETLKNNIKAAESLYNDHLREQYLLIREEADLNADLPILRANILSSQDKIAKYENRVKSLTAKEEQLETLSKKRNEVRNSITQYSELAGQLKLLIEDLDDFIAVKREFDSTTPQLRADIELHTIYISLLGAKGLQTQVIKRNINSVVSKINTILSSITTFRIAFDVSDTKIDLFISDSVAGDLTKDIPIELASGFQKFVISLIFRLSLTHSLFTSSKFVICDESFSTFDQFNLANVPELLNAVKGYYDFIFIISHIELLQNCVEVPIHIDIEEKLELIDREKLGNGKTSAKRETINSSVLNIITSHVHYPPTSMAPAYVIPVDINEKVNSATKEKAKKDAAAVSLTAIVCECGATVQKRSLSNHKKSAKHIAAIAKSVTPV